MGKTVSNQRAKDSYAPTPGNVAILHPAPLHCCPMVSFAVCIATVDEDGAIPTRLINTPKDPIKVTVSVSVRVAGRR